MSEQYVIGEGVILDARPASFMTRILGYLLDALVYGIVLFVGILVMENAGWLLYDYETQSVILLLVFAFVLLPTIIETLSRGRSLGKLATGVRVVRDDGGPISARHAFIRAIVGVGELWLTLGAVALVVSFTNDRAKRCGDLLAGTYVIRVRSKKAKLEQLMVPPPLVNWISNAEISKFPDGLGLSARQFLERRWNMTPQSRATMALTFYNQLSVHVAPQPPFNVPPEEYITAVIAERSRRESVLEQQRLSRAQLIQQRMNTLPFGIRDN